MESIKLVISWTFTSIFVFTSIATCLSLVGLVKFQVQAQQRRLFQVLIVQVIGICVAFVSDSLTYLDREPPPPVKLSAVDRIPDLESPRYRSVTESARDDLSHPPLSTSSTGSVNRQNWKRKTFDRITAHEEITMQPKNENSGLRFVLYSDKPGVLGQLAKSTGYVFSGEKMTVLDKHTTGLRGFEWLRVRVDRDAGPVEGWIAGDRSEAITLSLVQ